MAEDLNTIFRIKAIAEGFDEARKQIEALKGLTEIKVLAKADISQVKKAVDAAAKQLIRAKAETANKPIVLRFRYDDVKEAKEALIRFSEYLREVRNQTDRPVTAVVQLKGTDPAKMKQEILEVAELQELYTARRLRIDATLSNATRQRASEDAQRHTQDIKRQQLQAERAAANASRTARRAETESLKGIRRVEHAIGRMTGRVAYLFTAWVARFGYETIINAAQNFAALTGQIRGMEVAATRAGESGRQLFHILHDGLDGVPLKSQEAADALSKLFVGGLNPDRALIERQKAISTGAALLFGQDPSKMFNDFSTAALRTSRKIADNLGLVVRAKDAQAQYAAEIGKSVNDLTAMEKTMAFYRAMLYNVGAESLIAAGKIRSPFMELQKAKVQMNQLQLAFGELIFSGISPVVAALNDLSPAALKGAAAFTVWSVKTGLVVRSLQLAAEGSRFLWSQLSRLLAEQHNIRIAARAMSELMSPGDAMRGTAALQSRSMLGRIAGFTALTAAVGLAVAAFDNYYRRLAAIRDMEITLTQSGLQFTQFLASIGLTAEQASGPLQELKDQLADIDLSGEARTGIQDIIGSLENYSEELKANVEQMKLSEEQTTALKAEIDTLSKEGLKAYIGAVREAREQGGHYGVSLEEISLLAENNFVPAIRNARRAVEDMQLAQINALAQGLTAWDEFMNGVRKVLLFLVDLVAEALEKIGSALSLGLGAAIAGALEAALFPINAMISGVNSSIRSINAIFGTSYGTIKGITIPGLNVVLGGGVGSSWLSMFGGKNAEATEEALANTFSATGSNGRFGLGLYEQAELEQASPALSAYQRLIEMTKAEQGRLSYLPPGEDLETDSKTGGGAAAKNLESVYETALSLIRDSDRRKQAEEMVKAAGVGMDQLAAAMGAAYFRMLGFSVPGSVTSAGELAAWLKNSGAELVSDATQIQPLDVLFGREFPLQTGIATQEIANGVIKLLNEQGQTQLGANWFGYGLRLPEEAVAEALANLPALQAATEASPGLQAAMDTAEEARKLLDSLYNLTSHAYELGIELPDLKDRTKKVQEGLAELYEKAVASGAALNELGDQQLVRELRGAWLELIQETRQAAESQRRLDELNQQLTLELSELSFNSRLAMAREADPNRDQALAFNTAFAELRERLGYASKAMDALDSKEAFELRDQLRDLYIQLNEIQTQMKSQGILTAEGTAAVSQAIKDIEASFAGVDQQLSTKVETAISAEEELAGATNWLAQGTREQGSLFLSALGATTGALNSLTSSLGGAVGGLIERARAVGESIAAAAAGIELGSIPQISSPGYAALEGFALPDYGTTTTYPDLASYGPTFTDEQGDWFF